MMGGSSGAAPARPTVDARCADRSCREARILVVDDEPANLKLLRAILKLEGYVDVEALSDPRLVLAAYVARRPDLILLDINMPWISGFDVMAQIAALDDPWAPPILVLTAQTDEESLIRALQAGASDYLSKPFRRRELSARTQTLLLSHLAKKLRREREGLLQQRVEARTRELRSSRLEIVQRLGRAAELRDDETGRHISRMSQMSAHLARIAGWSAEHCDLLLNASPMHDLGKIGIPDAILLKPGRLDEHERAVMKQHAQIGADLLAGSQDPLLCLAHEIALGHHERWDGQGYPNAVAGERIPLSARIVSIADVFDALLSERPYKRAWPLDRATRWLADGRGTQFDRQLVEAFLDHLPEMLAIRAAHAEPAAPPLGSPPPSWRIGETR